MLSSLLQQILIFVQTHANCDFVKSLGTKDQVEQQIEAYHLRIGALVNAFHVCFSDLPHTHTLAQCQWADINHGKYP